VITSCMDFFPNWTKNAENGQILFTPWTLSAAFTTPTFTKLTTAQQHYVVTSCTAFLSTDRKKLAWCSKKKTLYQIS
jgi:hypothetical protein